MRTRDFKYIITSDGEEELYDLEKDPDETKNIVEEFPEKAKELKSILVKELKTPSIKKKAVTIDDKMRKRLKALGYI